MMMRSVRGILILAAISALIAVIVVAAAAGLGLRRAHDVLTRSAFSQEQLALATELEAGVNGYVARGAIGQVSSAARDAERARIARLITRYQASIRAERAELEAAGDAVDDAEGELASVAALQRLFTRIQADVDGGAARDATGLARDLGQFQALVQASVAQEHEEVRDAVARFERTRSTLNRMALALPVVMTLFGGICVYLVLARIRRPMRRLEAAMAAMSNGRVTPIGPLGLVEFDALGRGFDDMATEISAQRLALSDVNARLERDIVARTAEVEARSAQLAEIEATRRQFFAEISHELRTPITALCCEADVVLRNPAADVPALRDAVEQIVVQGRVVQRRLADLLAVSQAEDGRLVMTNMPFDLGDALRGSLALAAPFARANDARIDVEAAPGAYTVTGDVGWVQQALLTLLDNAIKFSPEAVVSVSLARHGSEAALTIADRGPGVPDAALSRLFERFHQEPSGRARGGVGLGLSIARRVVDHHGGRIAASNQEGGGLQFTIVLPLSTAKESA